MRSGGDAWRAKVVCAGLLGPYIDPIYGSHIWYICHAISSAVHVAPCCAHEWDRTIHVF